MSAVMGVRFTNLSLKFMGWIAPGWADSDRDGSPPLCASQLSLVSAVQVQTRGPMISLHEVLQCCQALGSLRLPGP